MWKWEHDMGIDVKSKMYKNKKWLENKYYKEDLNTYQIGGICKVSDTTIGYWLRKFNFSCRSSGKSLHIRFGNHCKLSQEALEWIDGEICGDGYLNSRSPWSAGFSYASKHLEYIQYVSDTLKSFGIEQAGRIIKRQDKKWGCYSYRYNSRDYEELLPIYKRWYPNGKKIIPRNLKLTPIMLRQFYIGDGCLKNPKVGRSYITLAANGFSNLDVEWLVNQLINLGFKAKMYLDRRIQMSTDSTKDFLNYIGKCPVNCYRYKFNYYKISEVG